MAKLIKNTVMQGVSGIIGKTLIYRQMKNGTTVIAMRPKPRTKPITPAEAATHQRFKEAAYIAKQRLQDPILRAQYLAKAKPGQSAYLVALTECLNTLKTKQETFKSPNIEPINTVNTTSKPNITISKNTNNNRNHVLPLKFKVKPIKHKPHRRTFDPSTTNQNYQSKSSLRDIPNHQPINDNSQSITAEGTIAKPYS